MPPTARITKEQGIHKVMAAQPKSSSNDKKPVFDVSKPGQTSADATSRPIIVTQTQRVSDPTVSSKPASDAEFSLKPEKPQPKTETSELMSHTGKTLTPAPEQPKTETTASPATQAKDDNKNEEEPAREKNDDSSDVTTEDVVTTRAEAKKEAQVSAEEDAKREAIQKLIESKQYFVPISEAQQHRSMRFILSVVILLLICLVGLNILADVGLLGQNFKPLIHVISL